MVFIVCFSNISDFLGRKPEYTKKTGVHEENHRPVANH